jgi:molybdopterin molybdotransferase
MISVDEALKLLEAESASLDVVESSLENARGLVLAETLAADRDLPPTDRSAMDGYAVRVEDFREEGAELDVIGEMRAGQPVGELRVTTGQAARIMTGAVVPPGADAVVMVEKTEERSAGRQVCIHDQPRVGQHIRRRGEDLKQGETALESGVPIGAGEVAALTSIGSTTLRVHRPPRVQVLSTGDEIVEPEVEPLAHQLRNSNAHSLVAQLAEMGLVGRYLGIASDERTQLETLVQRGLGGDLLLITGGVSAGKYDIVGDVLSAAGMRLVFHKVAVKPGKPMLAGRSGDCLVIGLPGNPVSTFTMFAVFVAPILRRMLGYRRWENGRVHATLTEPVRARAGREIYHLAWIEPGGDGLLARPVSSTGSGDVLALARANGWIVTPPEGADHAPGATVSTLLR